jgi:uncharacterized membrane protein
MKAENSTVRIVYSLAMGAVFAALVCVATVIFTIPIPATSGYFNFGETVIYSAALLHGPFVGSLAGGVGAAIADIFLGPQFLPGTLVIKGFEGIIVGFLFRKLPIRKARPYLAMIIAIVVGGLEMIIGYFIYEQLVLGYSLVAAAAEIPYNVVQMVIGLIVAVPVGMYILRAFPQLKT